MELITNKDQRKLVDEFASDLEMSLGVRRKSVSFNSLWDAHPPAKAKGKSLQNFMKDVSILKSHHAGQN